MPIQKETACKATAYSNLSYIINPEKTVDVDQHRWVVTVNMKCSGDASASALAAEFEEINRQYGKNSTYSERKYYHLILNFKNDTSVSPKMAIEIAKAYLDRFWLDHQAVLAVHLSRDQDDPDYEITQKDEEYDDGHSSGIHIHACINSINMMTGAKANRTDMDLAIRKDAANDIAYDLYGIEKFDWRDTVAKKRARQNEETLGGGADNEYNTAEINMHRDGRTSELDVLRRKILRCAMAAKSRQDFESRLNQEGVTLTRNTPKTISYKYKDGPKGTIRGGTLGNYYTAQYIDELIAYNCRMDCLRTLGESGYPEIDLERLRRYRKKRKGSYDVARALGLTMSETAYHRATELEVRLRIAIEFVRLQNDAGIELRGQTLYINGQPVQTDERLQKMYDMISLADKLSNFYGCENLWDLANKAKEMSEEIAKTKIELRKNRKIESSLKAILERKEALAEAMTTVQSASGTSEGLSKAKHLLYRHGYKSTDFATDATADRLHEDVRTARVKLEAQQRYIRSLYFEQRDLQRAQEELHACVIYFDALNYYAPYYGSDPMWMQRLDEQLEVQQGRIDTWQDEQTRGYHDLTIDDLLEVAEQRTYMERQAVEEVNKDEIGLSY